MVQKTPEEYLEMSKVQANKTLEKVLKEFNFKGAVAAVKASGWTWNDGRYPSMEWMKSQARNLLINAMENPGMSISSGPLHCKSRTSGVPEVVVIELWVQPVRASEVYIDGRVAIAKALRKMKKSDEVLT